jgi:hypothetical protein
MAKKRKTRAQKKLSDLRHNFSHSLSQTTGFQFNRDIKTTAIKTYANSYPYLVKDLSKTGILTISILIAQLILYFLLTNHLFKIPGLNY